MSYESREIQNLRQLRHKAEKKGKLSNEIGVMLALAGNYEESLEEHLEALTYHKEENNLLAIANDHRYIGESYSKLNNYEKALDHHNTYLTIVVGLNNKIEEQRAYATLGDTHYQHAERLSVYTTGTHACINKAQTCLELAEVNFNKALKLSEELRMHVDLKEYLLMKARVYMNLGLVYDIQLNGEMSINHFKRAIQITEKLNLQDDLFRCQYNLSGLYHRIGRLKEGLRHIEDAIRIAFENKDKRAQRDALVVKARIYVDSNEFELSKITLTKAYRLNIGDPDSNNLELNLKRVVKLIHLEDDINECPRGNHLQLLNIHEKIGDISTAMECFILALKHYKLMEENALLLGHKGEKLLPVYVSIEETCRDLNQFDEAYIYLCKQLHCKTEVVYQCRIKLDMAYLFRQMKKSINDIKSLYNEALQLSRTSDNIQLQIFVLNCLHQFLLTHQNKDNSLAAEIANNQNLLDELCRRGNMTQFLDTFDFDEGVDLEDSVASEDALDDIDLKEELDSSSDEEIVNSKLKKIDKKNQLGETQLHRACISGNYKKVKSLLDQGHPINPRDNCGWLPLHEACNHGFARIVALLLDRGARINDRGGEKCMGITPLHDACSCGNLDVVRLLVERGCDVMVRDDQGKTAVDMLIEYKMNAESEIDLAEYSLVKNLLSEAIKAQTLKSQQPNSHSLIYNKKTCTNLDAEKTKYTNVSDKSNNLYKTNLKNGTSEKNKGKEAIKAYKKTINELRNGHRRNDLKASSAILNIPALLPEEDAITDDWMINDHMIVEELNKIEENINDRNSAAKKHKTDRNSQASEDDSHNAGISEELLFDDDLKDDWLLSSHLTSNKAPACDEINSDKKRKIVDNRRLRKKIRTFSDDEADDVYNKASETSLLSNNNNNESLLNNSSPLEKPIERIANSTSINKDFGKHVISSENITLFEALSENDNLTTNDNNNMEINSRDTKNSNFIYEYCVSRNIPSSYNSREELVNENGDMENIVKRGNNSISKNNLAIINNTLEAESNNLCFYDVPLKQRMINNKKQRNLYNTKIDRYMKSEQDDSQTNITSKKILMNKASSNNKNNISCKNKLSFKSNKEFKDLNSDSNNCKVSNKHMTANNINNNLKKHSLINETDINENINVEQFTNNFSNMAGDKLTSISEQKIILTPKNLESKKFLKLLKIKILDEIIALPLHEGDENKSISWLCLETSKRYSQLFQRKPKISLMLKDGANLAPMDTIQLLFEESQEILGRVLGWEVDSIESKYIETCASLQLTAYSNIKKYLVACENNGILSLKDLALSSTHFKPIALSLQNYITQLHLQGNRLGDEGLSLLLESLANLSNIQSLNLASNSLTFVGIKKFKNWMETYTITERPLHHLHSLDLSSNNLTTGNHSNKLRHALIHSYESKNASNHLLGEVITSTTNDTYFNKDCCSDNTKICCQDYNESTSLMKKYCCHGDLDTCKCHTASEKVEDGEICHSNSNKIDCYGCCKKIEKVCCHNSFHGNSSVAKGDASFHSDDLQSDMLLLISMISSLRKLELSSCCLKDEDIECEMPLADIKLENLDLSLNSFSEYGLKQILHFLNLNVLMSLHISSSYFENLNDMDVFLQNLEVNSKRFILFVDGTQYKLEK